MHAIEKLLAKKAGLESVRAGQIVNCDVDIAGINDLYYQTVKSFFEMGGEKVWDPSKVVMFFDHYAPAATIKQAENHKLFRKFCNEQGIDKLMDINEGVCHQVLADYGLSHPGEIIVVTDSHTTTHGAFGAFGTGVGATSRKSQSITVMSGVAIATALMPPLCTAGYGIATGQLWYFLGAFYLFFINSFFIALAHITVTKSLSFDIFSIL